ncbi:hypothetical protein B0H10DRAFT_1957495 [Mycena sp. CBHHK59/15]|nr:hypothetical protein B0H10DRAFT_1957495 [Mycena sp. CBHHK59/15]
MDPLKSDNAGTTDTKMETDFTMQDVEQHTEVDKTEVHGGFNVWHTLTGCLKVQIPDEQLAEQHFMDQQLPADKALSARAVLGQDHWALDIRVLGVQAVANAAGPVLPQVFPTYITSSSTKIQDSQYCCAPLQAPSQPHVWHRAQWVLCQHNVLPDHKHVNQVTPDMKAFFRDAVYMWVILGYVLLLCWVVIYIQLFSIQHGVEGSDHKWCEWCCTHSDQPLGDVYSMFNVQILCSFFTDITAVIISILYGFAEVSASHPFIVMET